MSEPTTKIVFQLDSGGYYYGKTMADVSPLEPGVWHIPGNCVEVAPPAIPQGKAARWINDHWAIVPIPVAAQAEEPVAAIPAQVIPDEEFAPIPVHEPDSAQ